MLTFAHAKAAPNHIPDKKAPGIQRLGKWAQDITRLKGH